TDRSGSAGLPAHDGVRPDGFQGGGRIGSQDDNAEQRQGRRSAQRLEYSFCRARVARGGRDAEFKAAAGALDANSVAISKAVGSVYGADAEAAFLPLWRKHIGFVVDYTVGIATKDKAKQTKAVNELVGYTDDLGAFLSSANPNLPKATVAELVKGHILTLKDVIDAQAVKDYNKTYMLLRTATGHMHMIADPLADAIVKQFPDRYAGM